jgi:hypothetical protein
MPRHQVINQVTVYRPTASDIADLRAGDLAPDCFGDMRRVVSINHLGVDVQGKAFVTYYVERTPGKSKMSASMKEDEIVPTLPVTHRWQVTSNVPWQD